MEKKFTNSFNFEGFQTPEQKRRNFDQKIYMFPPHFNLLRQELETHWPVFFNRVNPEFDPPMSAAFAMAMAGPTFISMMNEAFNCHENLDTEKVDEICERYLLAARKMRGAA